MQSELSYNRTPPPFVSLRLTVTQRQLPSFSFQSFGSRKFDLGGRTWGVYQKSFLYHYENSGGCCSTIFHELGHCLGYNHNSTMTYGQWASGCADVFYKNNIKDFPVNSHTILKSRSNPNIY